MLKMPVVFNNNFFSSKYIHILNKYNKKINIIIMKIKIKSK